MSQTINDILKNIGYENKNSISKTASNYEKNKDKRSLKEILESNFEKNAYDNDYIHRPLSVTNSKVASLNKQAEAENKFGRIIGHLFNEKVMDSLIGYNITKIASEIAESENISHEEAEEFLENELSPNHLRNDLRPASPVSNSAYYHDQDALNLAVEKELLSRQLANPSSAQPGNGVIV